MDTFAMEKRTLPGKQAKVSFILLLLAVFLAFTCNGQEAKQERFYLSISPNVDQTEKTNKAIIETLAEFLRTKNASPAENKHWIQSDFQRYVYPYLDIYGIEDSKHGKDFYRPTLMEIIPTGHPTQRILKIAFIGHNDAANENQLRLIYNIMANIGQDRILFSRYLDHATENWKTVARKELTYRISPQKTANETEITQQQQDIEKICSFFDCSPISITYYSCVNPKELFEIKGFDYHPMMYADKTGGLADYGNIIYSGNDSETYTHEIIHVYTGSQFPRIDKFLDEGFATYFAGSGKFNYEWHRDKLARFLDENKDYNFAGHTDAYERTYFEQETPIPYLTAALIMERTMRVYGKDRLIELLKSETELWTTLKKAGLTRENINGELRKELKRPLTAWNR